MTWHGGAAAPTVLPTRSSGHRSGAALPANKPTIIHTRGSAFLNSLTVGRCRAANLHPSSFIPALIRQSPLSTLIKRLSGQKVQHPIGSEALDARLDRQISFTLPSLSRWLDYGSELAW